MRYFIRLSYDGKNFVGWQRQPNGVSVQEVIEENISRIMRESISITGCGRTDAGVHAKDFYAHFDTEIELPDNLVYKLNATTGPEIAIADIYKTDPGKHARFSAVKRMYKYFVHFSKDPFKEQYSFQLHEKDADILQMNSIAENFLGEHDFSAFEKKGSDNKNSVCYVYEAYWETAENGMVFTITANRFLRNMVRAITGTLLSISLGKMNAEEVLAAFKNKEQLNVKLAVPAKGLFLWNIEY